MSKISTSSVSFMGWIDTSSWNATRITCTSPLEYHIAPIRSISPCALLSFNYQKAGEVIYSVRIWNGPYPP